MRVTSFLLGCALVIALWTATVLWPEDSAALRGVLLDCIATLPTCADHPADRRRSAASEGGNDKTEVQPRASLDDIFSAAAGGKLPREAATLLATALSASHFSARDEVNVATPSAGTEIADMPDAAESLAALNERLTRAIAAHLAAPEPSPVAPNQRPAAEHAPTPRHDELVRLLSRRGDESLDLGDVTAARLFYARGADLGDPRAMQQLATTFDPFFLQQFGERAMRGDPARAAVLYRQAAAKGLPEAERRLARLLQRFSATGGTSVQAEPGG